jgi:radical SAM protein with 4Fe4S-binding SPASM domain
MRSSFKTFAKLGWLFAQYQLRKKHIIGAPIRLWIETASACNLKCVMCPNKCVAADQKGLMSLELFRKIVDECKTFASDVYLHHRGEPLLNPHLFEMMAYASKTGLKTRMHTNGTLLTEEKAKKMLSSGLDLLSFSVDGFTKETYEEIRVGANFETTVKNIMHIATLKKQSKSTKPYLVVERIDFKSRTLQPDQAKVKELEAKFLEAGVDEIITKAEYNWAEPAANNAQQAKRYYSACTFPWYAMVICADGTLTACPQDYHALLKMGNANNQTLLEIWNGSAYNKLRSSFMKAGDMATVCQNCDRFYRKTILGVPVQYMTTFLVDQIFGYNKLRKIFGTHERNV